MPTRHRRVTMRNGLLDNLDGREHPLDDAQGQIGLEEVDVETIAAADEDPFEVGHAPEPAAENAKLAALSGTTSDSVRLYLRRIGKISLLNGKEEADLARCIAEAGPG